jgi:hypothetical protein
VILNIIPWSQWSEATACLCWENASSETGLLSGSTKRVQVSSLLREMTKMEEAPPTRVQGAFGVMFRVYYYVCGGGLAASITPYAQDIFFMPLLRPLCIHKQIDTPSLRRSYEILGMR